MGAYSQSCALWRAGRYRREDLFHLRAPYDLIKRGKVRTPVEFGHKVFLAESAEGLITQYEVLKGNPPVNKRRRLTPPLPSGSTA